MDVGAWLRSLGLGEYAEAFARNHIDATVLLTLTADDLKEIGVVSLGHRKKLLSALAALSRTSAETGRPSGLAEPVPLAEGERRHVTVLFADLSGFTRLSSKLDAEELHELMGRFFGAVDTVVESHGGTVDKHIGDCIMGVFGARVAHGNDPERAVRAALAIHGIMPTLTGADGRQLRVHIGIASGQVVASGGPGQPAFTVTGESVNLASRLTDAAGAGETLISTPVAHAVSDLILAEAIGELTVKGLEQPVVAWRVLGLRDRGAEGEGRPLIGRRTELSQFQGAVAACREAGAGTAIYVRGEAGIGKSRLAAEFQRLAGAQGFTCHTGLVLDFGVGEGRDAIRAIVRSLLGSPPNAEPDARRAAGDRALPEGLVDTDHLVFLNDLLDLPQPTHLRAVYDAMDNAARGRGRRETLAELVRRASARQPVMLTVEDLHWADRVTLAYLAELTAAVAECPAVLLMTSRIEGDPLDEGWRGATRGSPLLTVDLGPLRRQEAIALAGGYIDTMPRLAMACVERAEGNPLFLEQLLRNAEETAAANLPGSIQSIVLARVDGLDPLDKRALQSASVIGQRFSLEALVYLLEEAGYSCGGLIRHYLVRPEGDDFLFAHSLIWEGVYSSLLQATRRKLHRRAAKYFAGHDPVLYAAHLDRADDPGASRAYLEAARAQAAVYRPARALDLVERGLALATERGDVCALTCLRGTLLHDLGSIAESIETYRRALGFASDDAERCEAWLGQAAGMRVTDHFDEAIAVLQNAERAAARLGLIAELARVHYLRGSLCFPLGDMDGCLRHHGLALEYAREDQSPELEARALSRLADANSMRARIKTAHDHFHRCIELARLHGFGRIEVANRHMRGIMRYYQNDLQGGAEDTLAGAEAAARVGHHRAEMVARAASGYILPDLGELERAKEQCEQALVLARRLGARRFEASSMRHLACVVGAQGRRAEAVNLLEQAYAISRESGVTFSGPWILGALAVVTDDPGKRRWALDEGETILGRGCVFHNCFWFYRHGMEASLEEGDWDRVERYAAALERFTQEEPVPSWAATEMAFQPEPGAALRLLRWTRFVDSEAQTFAALLDAFTQATGVPIQFASESFEDLRPKAAVAASIGSGPDIIWGLHADAHLYANAMLDVTDVADRLGQKHGGWYDVAELYGTRDGKWIMLPFVFSGVLLNYRGSMLVRAGFDGVPDNTDDFLRLAKALKKNGTPMGMPLGNASGDGNTWCRWLLWAFGGKVADENDNVVLDSPETVAALEYARELAENFIPGVESWLDSNNNKVFLAGDISLTNNSISIYAAARQQGLVEIAEDIHHAAYPVGPVGRRTELHVLFPFMLYSYTRYPNAAKALAMWLLEKPQYDRLIRAAVGYLSPTLPALKDNPVWAEDAKRLPFRDVAEFALPFSHAGSLGNAASSVFADFIVVTMVAEAASGAKTPQQAARDARARADATTGREWPCACEGDGANRIRDGGRSRSGRQVMRSRATR